MSKAFENINTHFKKYIFSKAPEKNNKLLHILRIFEDVITH